MAAGSHNTGSHSMGSPVVRKADTEVVDITRMKTTDPNPSTARVVATMAGDMNPVTVAIMKIRVRMVQAVAVKMKATVSATDVITKMIIPTVMAPEGDLSLVGATTTRGAITAGRNPPTVTGKPG